MVLKSLLVMLSVLLLTVPAGAAEDSEKDVIATSAGDLEITFVGHGTLMLVQGGTVIHLDPWSNLADYAAMPKADLVLVTHDHRDHLDLGAIQAVQKKDTLVVVNRTSAGKVAESVVMENGETRTLLGIRIEAVPAYNLVHMRSEGVPYHAKGEGNGYLLDFGDTRVYVAGDTENTPELKALKGVSIAFLPMNLPYTMTPEMAADAARALNPGILYPYHFGDTDTSALVKLLKGSGIDVRIRSLK